jgi:hypothetical protein
MATDISRMVPFWQKLSPARQDVLTATAETLGVWQFLAMPTLHAAADRGNIEKVCRILGGIVPDNLIEQYRRG